MGPQRRTVGHCYFAMSVRGLMVAFCCTLMATGVGKVNGEEGMRMPRVLKISRLGSPVLAAAAKEVMDPTAPEVRQIVDDMLATAADCSSLAGLAAPQVSIPYRIVLFMVPREKGEEIPLTVMINPRWEPVSNEMEEDWEGCLSIPGLVGLVPRYVAIHYSYQTIEGTTVKTEARGFHARVVQHECDHLDGKVYLQRMADMKNLVFAEEFVKHRRKEIPVRDQPLQHGDQK